MIEVLIFAYKIIFVFFLIYFLLSIQIPCAWIIGFFCSVILLFSILTSYCLIVEYYVYVIFYLTFFHFVFDISWESKERRHWIWLKKRTLVPYLMSMGNTLFQIALKSWEFWSKKVCWVHGDLAIFWICLKIAKIDNILDLENWIDYKCEKEGISLQ